MTYIPHNNVVHLTTLVNPIGGRKGVVYDNNISPKE